MGVSVCVCVCVHIHKQTNIICTCICHRDISCTVYMYNALISTITCRKFVGVIQIQTGYHTKTMCHRSKPEKYMCI